MSLTLAVGIAQKPRPAGRLAAPPAACPLTRVEGDAAALSARLAALAR